MLIHTLFNRVYETRTQFKINKKEIFSNQREFSYIDSALFIPINILIIINYRVSLSPISLTLWPHNAAVCSM